MSYAIERREIDIFSIDYIELRNIGEMVIYNKKYKFWFNHESPGHANLYITEGWDHGTNHFVINNYEYLKKRYLNQCVS